LIKYGENGGQTDLTYIDFDSYRLVQVTQLSTKQFGLFMIDLGFTIAHADPVVDIPDVVEGVLTGLSVIFTEKSAGLPLSIRASALSKGVDPISWFADPDILWFGIGLSYKSNTQCPTLTKEF
jgi:hypothetical protein